MARSRARRPGRRGLGCHRVGAAFVATAVASTLVACGRAGGAERPPARFRGVEVVPPIPAPDFTLTATDGRAFHFRAETEGSVALIFFGYTHCPDVCPVHMANLAAALHDEPLEVSERVRVMFVTVDPVRDGPERLRGWLNHFDPTFLGLRGAVADVDQIQTQFHLTPAVIAPGPDTSAIGHNAAVVAVIGDSARVLYPFGTREMDWLHDLPRLVAAIPRPTP